MLLSVCLITKNEERFLAGCLDSVRAAADEIVVVDAGSSDRTVRIAEDFGSVVLHRAWTDDFSAARNAGISAARGTWILCIDADERLSDAAALRPAIQQAPPEVGGFQIERHDVVTNPDDGHVDVHAIEILRLFRNHAAIRYEGIVHEAPDESVIRAGFEVRSLTSLKLTHLVHELPQERLDAKHEGYLRLLNRELHAEPRNLRARYYRAKTLWFLRRRDEARADFEAVVEDETCRPPLKASALCMLASLLSEEGSRGAAVERIRESLGLVPGQSLAFYALAEILYADGRYAHALEAYRRVRLSQDDGGGGADWVPGDLCITAEKRAYKLGCCFLALGDLKEAENQFRTGLSEAPDSGGCHYGLARVAVQRGDLPAALSHLEVVRRVEPRWRAGIELHAALRERASSSG